MTSLLVVGAMDEPPTGEPALPMELCASSPTQVDLRGRQPGVAGPVDLESTWRSTLEDSAGSPSSSSLGVELAGTQALPLTSSSIVEVIRPVCRAR
ncbi:hypothetical protein [Pseudonocardia alni]|uniref:hypothetical protein n=1 Tax=Pseudonocardia alni TaxID=33907 RepID=UPI00280B914E|nr:hypothetical protein [Pseudonocardia alni]